MNLLDLPIEILAIITTANLATFLAALKAPGIGPKLCHEYVQNYAKSIFIKIYKSSVYTEYRMAGKLHRVDGPAIIYNGERLEYFRNGMLHRTDGPCIIDPSSGYQLYCIYGLVHRKDGPAKIKHNGNIEYYRYGVKHRKDGPAIIHKSGVVEYYLYGQYYNIDDFNKLIRIGKN